MAKKQRDAQYNAAKDPEYIETPTCSRVHNHPDPCHHCWYGGCNKDFDAKIAEFQARLYSPNETGSTGGKAEMSSAEHGDIDLKINSILDEQQVCGCLNDSCSACKNKKSGMGTEPCLAQKQTENSKTSEKKNNIDQRGGPAVNKDTTFGPWKDSVRENGCTEEQFILTNVYQFKLPSFAHCQSTQNEYASDFITRHKDLNYKPISVEQWKLLCRSKKVPNKEQDAQSHSEESSSLPPALKQTTRNSWTYRDEDNLRIPCIADVIGSYRKTDAHKR